MYFRPVLILLGGGWGGVQVLQCRLTDWIGPGICVWQIRISHSLVFNNLWWLLLPLCMGVDYVNTSNQLHPPAPLMDIIVHNLWYDTYADWLLTWETVYLPKIQISDTYRSHGKTSHCHWLLFKIIWLWTQCGTNQTLITNLLYRFYLKPGKRSTGTTLVYQSLSVYKSPDIHYYIHAILQTRWSHM